MSECPAEQFNVWRKELISFTLSCYLSSFHVFYFPSRSGSLIVLPQFPFPVSTFLPASCVYNHSFLFFSTFIILFLLKGILHGARLATTLAILIFQYSQNAEHVICYCFSSIILNSEWSVYFKYSVISTINPALMG